MAYTIIYLYNRRPCYKRHFETLAAFLECIRLDRADGYRVTIAGKTAIAK